MGVYIDTQGIESAINNALVDNLPDFTPLARAAYLFELDGVEKRLRIFGADVAMAREDETMFSVAPRNDALARTLWRRRKELLGLLWPVVDVKPEAAPEPMGC